MAGLTQPMRRLSPSTGTLPRRCPSSHPSPWLGYSSPAATRSKVVLPEPFGPRIAHAYPSPRARRHHSAAERPPGRRLLRPCEELCPPQVVASLPVCRSPPLSYHFYPHGLCSLRQTFPLFVQGDELLLQFLPLLHH